MLMPRESGLARFDAFGSGGKTLHVIPDRHADVPMFEVELTALLRPVPRPRRRIARPPPQVPGGARGTR
jgi:hypothetical protein